MRKKRGDNKGSGADNKHSEVKPNYKENGKGKSCETISEDHNDFNEDDEDDDDYSEDDDFSKDDEDCESTALGSEHGKRKEISSRDEDSAGNDKKQGGKDFKRLKKGKQKESKGPKLLSKLLFFHNNLYFLC